MSESVNESEPMDLGPMEQAYEYHALLGNVNIECYERLKPLLHQAINAPAECSELLLLMLKLVNGASNLSETILADSVRVFDVEDSMKVSLDEEAMNNANMLIGPHAEPLSQREQVVSNVSLADLSASNASSDSNDDATASKSYSSSDATTSHANNDWESECESTQKRGKKRKRVPTSSSTAAVVLFDVESFKQTAAAEVETLAGQFDTINFGKSDTDTSTAPIAIVVDLVRMCQVQLVQEFNREELDLANIDHICNNFRSAIEGVDIFREELVCSEKEKLAVMESVPSYSRFTLDKLLSSLSRTEKVDFSGAIDKAFITSATRSIEALLGKKLTPKALEKFAVHQQSVKSTLNIVGHISVIIRVLAKFTVDEVFSCHDNRMSLIAELHLDRYGNEIDTTEFTALQLHELAMYYLKKDEYKSKRDKIRGLVLATKEGVLRSDQAEDKFNAVASEGSVGVFFSDSTSRRNAMIIFVALSLADDIEAMAASGSFDEYGGFNLRLLDLSWRDITTSCRNFIDIDFFAPHTPKAKSGRKMLESLANKKKKKQEQKTSLIIYSKQQMDSLQALCQFD